MASIGKVNVRARDAVRGITVNVRVSGVKRALLRMKLGVAIIRLGTWVAGIGMERVK